MGYANSLPDFFKIKRVGFLGFGRAVSGAYEFLKNNFPHLAYVLRDEKERDAFPDFFKACYSGNCAFDDINEEILFLSPSVRRDRPELMAAKSRGVRLYSDLELFLDSYQGLSFGVTGSDGKSTTTYLISELLKESHINASPCGNYGVSPCAILGTASIPVLELSSFQLHAVSPRLSTAVITNVSENHLDWHKSYEEYLSAKLSILNNADSVVYDYDCEELQRKIHHKYVGAVTSLKLNYSQICKQLLAKYYITLENDYITVNGEPIVDINNLGRREEYNIRNMMLALGAAYPFISANTAVTVFKRFAGLPHRAEVVKKDGHTTFINSSIDTTPARAAKTIRQIKGNCVVILCGRGKGLSLGELPEALLGFTKGAVLMGEFGEEVFSKLHADPRFSSYRFILSDKMEDAVIKSRELLENEGTVLLSPAATSYDAYDNFEKRGEDFSQIVRNL